jgi:hypothetical protein
VETGDGYNDDSGGLPPNEENVIRLPRDWLGPPEELVPIGRAARARATQHDLDHGMPPAADAFWSEDSAALHDAVQAPSTPSRDPVAPPVGLVPPVAGRGPTRAMRRPSLRAFRALRRLSWRPTLLTAGVVTFAAIAVIGTSEGPASHRVANRTPAPRSSPSSSDLTASANAAAAEKAAAARRASVTMGRQSGSHARTRAHAGHDRVIKTHHRAAVHHSAGSPSPTVTQASPAPVHSSATSSATTTPAVSTASTVASTGSRPAAGPPGPTQLGKISGGCTPKC